MDSSLIIFLSSRTLTASGRGNELWELRYGERNLQSADVLRQQLVMMPEANGLAPRNRICATAAGRPSTGYRLTVVLTFDLQVSR
jgi:hypothetical protein